MELSRQEWQYSVLKHLFGGKNFFAPLSKTNPPRRILDIATGTGTWVMEMSDEFPDTEIYGTDLSPVQPVYVNENVQFWIEDA
jgi:metalloendopeptidase OMA1, mitochondrial